MNFKMAFLSATFTRRQLSGGGLLLLQFFAVFQPTQQGVNQRKLLTKLLTGYNVLERPVENDRDSLMVTVGFAIQQIINLDQRYQVLQMSSWIDLSWTDVNMRWKPADYGNITSLQITPEKLWRPDFLLYDSASEKFDGSWSVNCIVNHDGNVHHLPPAMLKSSCKVNIQWFPFDKQVCRLKFGSWTFDESQVNVTIKSSNAVDLSGYVENGEWDMKKVEIVRHSVKYDCCTAIYPDVTLYLHLKRLGMYYYFNLIIPTALISAMALMVFLLPVDSGEKIGLSVTILLSLTVFMLVVAESVPRTSEALPLLGIYFASIMFICSITLICSVWVLNLHYHAGAAVTPPNWVRYGLNVYVARAFCMHYPGDVDDDNQYGIITVNRAVHKQHKPMLGARAEVKRSSSITCPNNVNSLHRAAGISRIHDVATLSEDASSNCLKALSNKWPRSTDRPIICSRHQMDGTAPARSAVFNELHSQIGAIQEEVEYLAMKSRGNEHALTISKEWRFAARVIDRLCLIVFLSVTLASTLVLLFIMPSTIDESVRHNH